MAYTIGLRTAHRRLLLDCNDINVNPSAPVGMTEVKKKEFVFPLFQDIYMHKVLMKRAMIPYSFYNTLSAPQGVDAIRMRVTLGDTGGGSWSSGFLTMSGLQLYQLTPQNFLDLYAACFDVLGVGTYPTPPDYNLDFDADDQQLGLQVVTPGISPSVNNINSLKIEMEFVFNNRVLSPVGMQNLWESMYSSMMNATEMPVITTGATTTSFLVTVHEFTGIQNVGTKYKPQIMDFVAPQYLLVHADFMQHSLVKPSILPYFQGGSLNWNNNQRQDANASTVVGIAWLLGNGTNQSGAPGRYYQTEDDGNQENYIEMNSSSTLNQIRLWFTFPDGTVVEWDKIRPLIEFYFQD